MACDQFLAVIHAESVRISFHRHLAAGKARRYRIAVALEAHPELPVGAQREHPADIEGPGIGRLQMGLLLPPQIDWPAMGFPVQPDIGHRLQPDTQRRIERGELRQVQAGKKVALDIADTSFDPPLQMSSQLHMMQLIGRNFFV